MTTSSEKVAELIFRKIIRKDIGSLVLDGDSLSVLMALDGEKNLQQVAEKIGVDFSQMKMIVANLLKLKLVERVEITKKPLGQDFLQFMLDQLSYAMGPLARIAVVDAFKSFGFSQKAFPAEKADELVAFLAKGIPREDKKIEFKKAMVQKIRSREN